jgi:hypothetical protein
VNAPEPMLALSLWQPWAAYAGIGAKPTENRGWRPRAGEWTGQLAIHAGHGYDRRPWAHQDEPGRTGRAALEAAPAQLRRAVETVGAIVAVVTVTGYHRGDQPARPHCGPWCDIEARWHWELSGATALAAPVPTRGQRGVWTLPADVAAAVRAQLEGSSDVR